MENYVLGGLATAAAATFTNPLDVAKTRLQVQGELLARGGTNRKFKNVFHCIYRTYQLEGLAAVQKGLIAAWTYQFFMNGVRLGSYSVMKEYFGTDGMRNETIRYAMNAFWGGSSGMLGALFASPVYLAKTRLQSQGGGTGAVQHNYRGMWDVLRSVTAANGFLSLYDGASAAMIRVAFGSAAQLATYDWSKRIVDSVSVVPEGLPKVVLSAGITGIFVSVMMNPMDVISTRMYNSTGLYTSMWSCIKTTVQKEGLLAFYKGMSAQYARIIPHSTLTFVFWESLKAKYKEYQ